MQNKIWNFLLLTMVTAGGISACKTPRRATGVAGATTGMPVQLLNYQPEDQKNPNIIPELHRCGGEPIVGSFTEPTMASFPVKGIKPGTVCEVRLVYPNAPAERYLFLAEPNLLYVAPNVVISQAVTGKLQGTAILAKRYNLNLPPDPAKSFRLTAEVEFPVDVSGSAALIMSQPLCDPTIASVAGITMRDGKRGSIEYAVAIDPQVAANVCKSVNVWISNNLAFTGKINNGDGRKIVPVPAGTVAIDDKVIKMTHVTVGVATGVTVTTEAGGSCKEGEVFDIRQRKCVPIPPTQP